MEKECCRVTVTEIDEGYRIEVTGKDVKEKRGGYCLPLACCTGRGDGECCPPKEKKSE